MKKIILLLGLAALLISTTAPFPVSAATAPKEIYMWHAEITKLKLLSTGPGSLSVRVLGNYSCDKVRYHSRIVRKTIYIEVWDVKNKKNDCTNSNTFGRDLSFSRLVPGKYTVLVNVDPETGKAQRQLSGIVVPVYPSPTPVK